MKIFITVLAVSLAFWAGLQSSYWLGFSEDESVSDERNPLYWVAPMDASFRRDQPGKSPMGMDLIPVYAEDKQQNVKPGEVKISAAVENNLGVKTVEVAFSALSSDIDTVGYIQFDEDRLHHVHLRVDGWIEKLNVSAVGFTRQPCTTRKRICYRRCVWVVPNWWLQPSSVYVYWV
jgi:Cu(I)/Ag(I) efflux system membrane fusion protein